MKLSSEEYLKLVDRDVKWLLTMPDCPERNHILAIVGNSPIREYDDQRELTWHRNRLSDKIHISKESSQPHIHIECDDSWTTPSFNKGVGIFSGIYKTQDGRLYTFEDDKVTCEKCKNL